MQKRRRNYRRCDLKAETYSTVGFLGSKCGSKSRVCEQVEKAFRFNRLVDPNRYRTYDNEETLKHGLNDLLPLWV